MRSVYVGLVGLTALAMAAQAGVASASTRSAMAPTSPVSPVPGANFGHSVAVYRTTAVVGAPESSDGQDGVSLFSRAGGSWRLTKTLSDPNHSHDGDFFGYSVAISGATIVVGAPEEDNRRGVVYVFGRSSAKGNDWHLQAKLVDPISSTRAVEMTFGASVAIDGNTLLVGAPGTNGSIGAGRQPA